MLILNEQKHALHLLEYGFSGLLNFQDIKILAKHFRNMGLPPRKIRENIVEFYIKFDPGYNEVILGDKIDRAIKNSKDEIFKIPFDIYITKKEIENISRANNYKYEKVLFVALVICRYNRLLYGKEDIKYSLGIKFSVLLKLAKVYVNKQDKNALKNSLSESGFVLFEEPLPRQNIISNDFMRLNYFDEHSEKEIWVTDFDNIVNFYPFYCKVCGKQTEKKIHNQEMCDSCAKEKNRNSAKNRYKRKI